jgi:hypothetical protein
MGAVRVRFEPTVIFVEKEKYLRQAGVFGVRR